MLMWRVEKGFPKNFIRVVFSAIQRVFLNTEDF